MRYINFSELILPRRLQKIDPDNPFTNKPIITSTKNPPSSQPPFIVPDRKIRPSTRSSYNLDEGVKRRKRLKSRLNKGPVPTPSMNRGSAPTPSRKTNINLTKTPKQSLNKSVRNQAASPLRKALTGKWARRGAIGLGLTGLGAGATAIIMGALNRRKRRRQSR